MKLTVFWPTVNVESKDASGVSQKTVNQSLKLTVFWPTVNVESKDASGVSQKTVNQSLWLDTNEVGAGGGQNWNVACGTFVFDREMPADILSAFTFTYVED